MLQARILLEFKGADNLLIWGDDEGIESLRIGLKALTSGSAAEWALPVVSDRFGLIIIMATPDAEQVSEATLDCGRIRWRCSSDVVAHTELLVAALASSTSGHQYVDASGPEVQQILIAFNEYPPNLDVPKS